MSDDNEVITTVVTGTKIIPLARKCIEKIDKIREQEDIKFLTDHMNEYNSRWYNKLFGQSFKNIEEAKESIESDESTFPWWFCKYPSCSYYTTQDHAKDIVKHYDSGNMDATYTIPIDIYNYIASFCKD